MRFCITTNKNLKAIDEALKLKDRLVKKGHVFDENNPEIVFSIGGDGNFLKTVQRFINIDPIYATVNFGKLGYLCEYKANEINVLEEDIENKDLNIREISLLETQVKDKTLYAVNEFKVQANSSKTFKFNVLINDTLLENFKGDGCLITTSIGSSGSGKSLGGALVDNEIEMIQFVEIGALRNKVFSSIGSPYVLNYDKKITLDNFKPTSFSMFYDCKSVQFENFDGSLTFKLSDKKIKFLKNKRNNYIGKTREAFVSD